MKYLKVHQLIEILQEHDLNMTIIISKGGKGHDFGLIKENIEIITNPYFPEYDPENEPPEEEKYFLRLGYF